MAAVIPVATPATRHRGITQTNVIAAELVPSVHHTVVSRQQAVGVLPSAC